jgi:hypothetical protein
MCPIDAPDEHVQAKPCRPTISCTADIVQPGALEVEVGGAYANGDLGLRGVVMFSARPWLVIDAGGDTGCTPRRGPTRSSPA